MKPRKWIIVVFLLFLVLICGLSLVKKTLAENRNLEKRLIQHISPAVGGTFDVEKVDIGFFSVYLKGTKITIPLQSFALKVKDIKIGFSFFKLVAYRGDLAKSINKIILVDPVIDVSFPEADSSPTQTLPKKGIFSISQFPVEDFLIKNCSVFFSDRNNEKITLGEQLTGRITGNNGDLRFELTGTFAAKKRNLFLSGVLSENVKKQHVSVRLAKARIKKEIRWQNITVSKGKLDGVCEISFSDERFPNNIEANGAITIEDGVGSVEKITGDIDGVNLKVNFSGKRVDIDTLTAHWNDMDVVARGSVGFTSNQYSSFYLRIEELKKGLSGHLPDFILNTISGKNWLEFYGKKKKYRKKFTVNIIGGGFMIREKPVTRFVGQCSFTEGSITVDTAYFEYSDITLGLTGLLNFDKSPLAYSFSVGLDGNTQTFSPDLSGNIAVNGTVHGLGSKPLVNLLINGDSISYFNMPLGNPQISVASKEQKIVVKSQQKDKTFFSVYGTVDSIHQKQPLVNFETELYKDAFCNVLNHLPDKFVKVFGSLSFMGSVRGHLPNPKVKGRIKFRGDNASGTCNLSLSRVAESDKVNWKLASERLIISDSLFHLLASGYLQHDSLFVTTFSTLNSLKGTGFFELRDSGSMHFQMSGNNVPLEKLNTFLFKSERVFEKGYLNGKFRVSGSAANLKTYAHANIRDCAISGISLLETDVVFNGKGKEFTILPFVIRKDKKILISIDTVSNIKHLSFSGSFNNVDLGQLLKKGIEEDYTLEGLVSGRFNTSQSGLPVKVTMQSKRITFNSWKLDSAAASIRISKKAVMFDEIVAYDSTRCKFVASGQVPWPFFSNNEDEEDTLWASLNMKGDLLASLEHNCLSPVGGNGVGEIEISFYVTSDEWHFIKAYGTIPGGRLTVTPFVPDGADNIRVNVSMDDSAKLNFNFYGKVNRRPISIFISHAIPDGFEPIMLGNLNCGVINVKTVKNGIYLFLPGFMERGRRGEFEFAPKKPFDAFAISGPLDRLKISGTWIVRNGEFTFPFLEDDPPPMEEDPFPYIDWDLDVRAGNRNVVYFYNVGRKMRRFFRFTECIIDPSSAHVKIRGRDIDKKFRIYGRLRSYKGYAFYGRNFDRNLKVGVDFIPEKLPGNQGYDNMPIIWGSAEAFSDSSRFDRIKLTLLTHDSLTGVLREKGRFKDISFRVSSDYEEIPGEAESEFYREAGLKFITLKGAGEFVSDFGDQYFQKYLLQRAERKLARRLGLDVISFETSFASNYFNYFYNNQNHWEDFGEQWDYLAFANVGVTVGRYFLRDRFFLKWRTELIPRDMILSPEHNIGVEFQPMEYLWLDFNYGFYRSEDLFKSNPKLRAQLRLPIGKFRDFLNF
jgi:hypothetical protein